MRIVRPVLLALIAALAAGGLASCGGDDDFDFTKRDAGGDRTTLPPPPPPPTTDAGDADAPSGACIELADFVLDLVRNQTADNNRPEALDNKTFCSPDKEDPKAFNALFP